MHEQYSSVLSITAISLQFSHISLGRVVGDLAVSPSPRRALSHGWSVGCTSKTEHLPTGNAKCPLQES